MNYCPNCGIELEENSNFCSSCGEKLNGGAAINNNNSFKPASHNVSQGSNDNSRLFPIFGWVCAGISLFLIPILFGAGGVIFGYLYRKTDETHGTIIIIASIALALLGMIFGAAVGDFFYYYYW